MTDLSSILSIGHCAIRTAACPSNALLMRSLVADCLEITDKKVLRSEFNHSLENLLTFSLSIGLVPKSDYKRTSVRRKLRPTKSTFYQKSATYQTHFQSAALKVYYLSSPTFVGDCVNLMFR